MNIVTTLNEKYYQADQTPKDFVSSHWEQLHKQLRIETDQKKIKSLKGIGFGDLQNFSFPYRVFSWFTIVSYLFKLSGWAHIVKLMRVALDLVKRMGFPFTYDCFRQVCALSLILNYLPKKKELRVLNIGDGYGFLSALIKEIIPEAKICLVDLGKTLLFQAHYCLKAHPQKKHALIVNGTEQEQIRYDADFIYCPAEELPQLAPLSFDLAINIASMQEMNERSIKYYFDFLRTNMKEENLFYCCNRLEKRMPDGEVSRFFSYPWSSDDNDLIDETCSWYRHFFSIHKAKMGPKIFKWRVPFVNYFDGMIRHRLTILSSV